RELAAWDKNLQRQARIGFEFIPENSLPGCRMLARQVAQFGRRVREPLDGKVRKPGNLERFRVAHERLKVAQGSASWCAVTVQDFERKAAELVTTGFDFREVQAFDHPDAGAQESVMCFDAVLAEAAD